MNRYTQEQIEAADSIDLVAYAQYRGYELEREGNQFKMKDHDSLYMKGNRCTGSATRWAARPSPS